MTITTNPARDEYTATQDQDVFTYTFRIYADTDLNVYVTPAGQVANDDIDLVTLSGITGVGDPNGGTVTLTTPANEGDLVTIASGIPVDRTTDYQNNGDFRPETVNEDFDRIVSLVKQVEDATNRSALLEQAQQGSKPLTLPQPESFNFIRWRDDLTGFENVNIPDIPTASTLTETKTLVDGQTAVLFDKVNTQVSVYYLCGNDDDNGRLCPEDYTFISGGIELKESSPGGTDILAVQTILETSAGPIQTVFGRLGPDIIAEPGDYDASQINNDSSAPGAFVSDALTDHETRISTNETNIADNKTRIDTLEQVLDKIRYSKLDNPITHLFKKNNIEDTLCGSLSITRSSTATYIDRLGIVRTAAIDEPREEKEGWLIEGQSTNVALQSENFPDAVWSKSNVSIAADATQYAGLSGWQVVTRNASTSSDTLFQVVTLPAGDSVISCHVKQGTANTCTLLLNEAGSNIVVFDFNTQLFSGSGAANAKVQVLADGVFRISLKVTSIGGVVAVWIGFDASPSIGQTFLATGYQVENLPFATSYIPTESSSVTRLRDEVYIANPSGCYSDPNKGLTWAQKLNVFGYIANFSENGAVEYPGGGTSLFVSNNSLTNQYTQYARSDGLNDFRSFGDVTPNIPVDYVSVIDGTNSYAYRDGALVSQSNNAGVGWLNEEPSRIIFTDNAYRFYGHIQDFRIYDFALNESEVAFLAGE